MRILIFKVVSSVNRFIHTYRNAIYVNSIIQFQHQRNSNLRLEIVQVEHTCLHMSGRVAQVVQSCKPGFEDFSNL